MTQQEHTTPDGLIPKLDFGQPERLPTATLPLRQLPTSDDDGEHHHVEEPQHLIQHPETRPWEFLPVYILLPFAFLFVVTVFPRLSVPFELEWNEGQSAEQAWRFAKGLPVYAGPEGGWVPYMYAPLYHMLHAALMKLTGIWSLSIARLISLLSTIATVMAILMIVHDRTRRLVPALTAALLYFAYFKPTGFWYDIARVDSLACALAAWGMFCTLRRDVSFSSAMAGLLLLLLGTFAKQTVAPIALFCALALIPRQPRAFLLGSAAICFITANFLFWFMRSGNDEFLHYTIRNAIRHNSSADVFFPSSMQPLQLLEKIPEAERALLSARITAYRHEWLNGAPPRIWTELGRHVWLLLPLAALWLLLPLTHRRAPAGWLYLIPALILAWGGIGGYMKNGGYMNNFMPLFLALCIITGFAMEETRSRLFPRRPALFTLAITALLLLQVVQPWNFPSITDGPSNWAVIKTFPREQRDAMWRYVNSLREPAQNIDTSDVTTAMRYSFHAGRFCEAGLPWLPQAQWPAPESRRVFDTLIAWLQAKADAKEPVWLLHHQWYGILTGHPIALNPDMVRCAQYAGDPYPREQSQPLRLQQFKWLIIDSPSVINDWLPGEMKPEISERYEVFGPLTFLEEAGGSEALRPVTGAEKWPMTILRLRNFDGEVGTVPTATLARDAGIE